MPTRYYLSANRTTVRVSGNLPYGEQSADDCSPFATNFIGPTTTASSPFDLQTSGPPAPSGWFQNRFSSLVTGTLWATNAYWGAGPAWWATKPFSSGTSLAAGTASFVFNHANAMTMTGSAIPEFDPYYQGTKPVFHVYVWRQGVGKVATIVDRLTGSAPPRYNTYVAVVAVFSGSVPSSPVTIQTGDRIILELWTTASVTASNTVGNNWPYYSAGTSLTASHGQFADTAAWVEFSENLPALQSESLPLSTAFMKSVEPHPNDSNKLRITFSQAIDDGFSAANFSLSPSAATAPVHAAFVPGKNDQIDLHFGKDLEVISGTIALWKMNESTGAAVIDETGTYPAFATAPVVNDGLLGPARSFNGSSDLSVQSTVTGSVRTILYDEHMIDAIVRPTGTIDTWRVILKFGGTQGTNESQNCLTALSLTNDKRIHTFAQYSASVNTRLVGGADPYASTDSNLVEQDKLHVITLRKKRSSISPSGNWFKIDFFLDGKIVGGVDQFRRPTGGTSAETKWSIGRFPTGNSERFGGLIDSVRVISGTLTDGEIVAYHTGVLYPFQRGTLYTLSASGLFDTTGAILTEASSSFTFGYLSENAQSPSGTFSMTRTYFNSGSNVVVGAAPATSSFAMLREFFNSGSISGIGHIDSGSLLSMKLIYNAQYATTVVPTPPTIGGFSPAIGSQIQSNQVITLQVNDNGPLRRVILHVKYPSHNIQEVIHDGDSFGLSYQGPSNVQTTIPTGYQYTILRDGGWPESPVITPFAIDITGSENL